MKDATGNEVTIQTKAVDAAGKPPVEEKVVKVPLLFRLDDSSWTKCLR